MDEALLALLEKKEFAYITIRELCAAAVNRSTFYLHYQNITELLEESIAYMNRQFYECFPPSMRIRRRRISFHPLIWSRT